MQSFKMRSADSFVPRTTNPPPVFLPKTPPSHYETPIWLPPVQVAGPADWFVRRHDGPKTAIAQRLRVGSAPDNDLVLSDPFVSQHHAVITSFSDRIEVVDLGSRNGTFVNGVRLQKGELRHGGILRLGAVELQVFQAAIETNMGLLGDSAVMVSLRQQIARFARSPMPVLLLGESGTGKELVAKALHKQSGRSGPLVPINCGALPRELIESELFGHERGAFTGAAQRHLGCFIEATGGTLFFDEIGELPLELQPRLLRVLENQHIRPVGSAKETPVDVRIIAATHRDLSRAVAEGRFREDLFYRLAGLVVELPALRDHRSDIPLLVRHFLAEAARLVPGLHMDDAEVESLSYAAWPGNVRQLKMAVLRAAHLHGPKLLGKHVQTGPRPSAASTDSQVTVVGRKLHDIEKDVFATVLRHAHGNQRVAAAALDLPKSSLNDRLRRLGIETTRVVMVERKV